MTQPPRVFVSHASEDKSRFVMAFAARLRQSGVDAWLDKWEMLPGDSLVDKIFEEGLKSANAVIVVLSRFSVGKPWVREELNAAVVQRINTGSKLIPVVIDDCDVPQALRSTVWEKISDLNAYDASFDRIVASIFGASDKPPIGPRPPYTLAFLDRIAGLTSIDSLVLRLACEHALSTGLDLVEPGNAFVKDGNAVIPESELIESLEVLDQKHYIRLIPLLGSGGPKPFRLTTHGFETYAKSCISGYPSIVQGVIASLVNHGLTDNHSISAALGQPRLLIDHVFDLLESAGHIKRAQAGDRQHVFKVLPTLRRALAAGDGV